MTQVYREHLDFIEEAKKAFEKNVRLETYRNENDTLIALRYGQDRDCMKIYKLGEEVGFFANIMNAAPRLYVGKQNNEYRKAITIALNYVQDGRSARANSLYKYFRSVLRGENDECS